MGLPKVQINITDGALGGFNPTGDGVAGLVTHATAVAGSDNFKLNTPYNIKSLRALNDLGVTATNNPLLYKNVKEFYDTSGDGASLWILGVAESVAMADLADKTKAYAKMLLDAAKGDIRLLAIATKIKSRETISNGISNEVDATVIKAQALAVAEAMENKPVQVLLDGKAYNGKASDLKDYKKGDYYRVSITLGATDTSKNASVGLVLGTLAKLPVQRNIARVKNGSLPITAAYFTNSTTVESNTNDWDSIHDKGYILIRTYQGRSGYFFSDDPTLASNTSDLSSIARNRIIDKASRITFDTYTEELGDEVLVDVNTGYLAPETVMYLQAKIETDIKNQMVLNSNIVAVKCIIDPKQDVQSTKKINVQLRLIPFGYYKEIVVDLGFTKAINN